MICAKQKSTVSSCPKSVSLFFMTDKKLKDYEPSNVNKTLNKDHLLKKRKKTRKKKLLKNSKMA